MYSSTYEIAIETGFSDNAANALSFLDYETIEPEMRVQLVNIIYEATEKYNDASDDWNTFKESSGQDARRTAKRITKKVHEKKIKKAKELLDMLNKKSLLTGESDASISPRLKAELWIQIFKWEQETPYDSVYKIGASQPNKNFIRYILEEIHKDFNIPNQPDNIDFFLPKI